jgi:hypothetical protein
MSRGLPAFLLLDLNSFLNIKLILLKAKESKKKLTKWFHEDPYQFWPLYAFSEALSSNFLLLSVPKMIPRNLSLQRPLVF